MTIRDTDRRGGIPTASPEDRDRKSRTYGRRVSKVTASRGCSQTEANKLLKRLIALTAHHEPPYTEPYVRWCGRTAGVIPPPTRYEQVYYSVGGGFVVDETGLAEYQDQDSVVDFTGVPYPFKNAEEMVAMGRETGHSIAEMKRANELLTADAKNLDAGLDNLWAVMNSSIDRGMHTEGKLPGGLDVKRRAKCIYDNLNNDRKNEKFAHTVMDWISVYAMAVNEENAAGGRIITAPTNGAAGIIPAVIRYYLEFCPSACVRGVREFLLVSSAIGGLIKHNASISGAEVGCQGEVGSASAMAAAGLAAVLGGSNEQVENAAEIALEHHLGMTCDPIGGLVQVPCIERNALGAVKAISAASLALRGDGTHFVPLDSAIKTMRETGHDMLTKYKETSQGGLAINVTEC